MPTVDAECPECATTLQVDEADLGRRMKCPKCKFVFDAERADGAYELVDPPSPPKSRRRGEEGPGRVEPDEVDESTDELRRKMEEWADE